MSIHEKLNKLTYEIYGNYDVVHDSFEIYKRLKEAYNLGVEISADNAEIKRREHIKLHDIVDKDSILKLKI